MDISIISAYTKARNSAMDVQFVSHTQYTACGDVSATVCNTIPASCSHALATPATNESSVNMSSRDLDCDNEKNIYLKTILVCYYGGLRCM